MGLYAELLRVSGEYSRQAVLAAVDEDWSGIGFRLGMHRFIVPQAEVAEVLSPPRLTRVPGAPPWVSGLANLRGTVVPLFDLGHLLLGQPTVAHSRNRYLVLSDADNPAGLLVDAVSGLRRLANAQRQTADTTRLPVELRPYVRGEFHIGEEQRIVFSLRAVLEERLTAHV